MQWEVSLSDLKLDIDEIESVKTVLEKGWLSMGDVTEKFEADFRSFSGAKYTFAVTNGTAALHLACLAAGINAGDEVILPSLTFVATANAVRYTGAAPVFADISSDNDLTISPDSILEKISNKTKAILVMHYGGYACNMRKIMEIARDHHLVVIEDAAHAPGSLVDDQHLGTIGDLGCFSFFANKNMTTAEGGMIVTDSENLAEKIRLLRSHGMTTLTWDRHQGHAWSYDVVELGYNYRLDEIRSALGITQLQKLPLNNARRRQIVEVYRQRFNEELIDISIPFKNHLGISSAHLFPILLPEGKDRQVFVQKIKDQKIQTSMHYPPIHHFSIYQDPTINLPKTDSIAKREVTLPLHPLMDELMIDKVVDAVKNAM